MIDTISLLVMGADKRLNLELYENIITRGIQIDLYFSALPIPKEKMLNRSMCIDSSQLYDVEGIQKQKELINSHSHVDLQLIEEMTKSEFECLKCVDRAAAIPESVEYHHQIFYELIHLYQLIFEKYPKITHVYFPNNPHFTSGITLYYVAKYYRKCTLISRLTYVDNYHVVTTDWKQKINIENSHEKSINTEFYAKCMRESDSTILIKSYNQKNFKSFYRNSIFSYVKLIRIVLSLIRRVFINIILQNKYNWKRESALLSTNNISGFSVINAYIKLFNKIKKINKYHFSLCSKPILTDRYIYLAMHFQPESNTIPEAGIFSDQYLIASALAEHLPDDIDKIYVKEHPFQIKSWPDNLETMHIRSENFYRKLASMDRVVLIDPFFDSKTLIQNSQAVCTVAGTTGWEALKMGKPAILFGNPWYSACKNCVVYNFEKDFKNKIDTLLRMSPKEIMKNLDKFLVDISPYVFKSVSTVTFAERSIKTKVSDSEEKEIIKEAGTKIVEIIMSNDGQHFIDNQKKHYHN
jgi:hypothetical protein